MKKFALSLSNVVFIMLINVKMPTIVGILTFMSGIRIKFMLISTKHEMFPAHNCLDANNYLHLTFVSKMSVSHWCFKQEQVVICAELYFL